VPTLFGLDEAEKFDPSAKPLTDAERNQDSRRESLLRWSKLLHLAATLAGILFAFGVIREHKLFGGIEPLLIPLFEIPAWLLKKAAKSDSDDSEKSR
jgi:hypothetical protein